MGREGGPMKAEPWNDKHGEEVGVGNCNGTGRWGANLAL